MCVWSSCVFVYVHIHVCVCIYVWFSCVFVYVYKHLCKCECTVFMCIYVDTYTFVCGGVEARVPSLRSFLRQSLSSAASCSVHQASCPVIFQKFSCLHLPSHGRGLIEVTDVIHGLWGSELRPSPLRSRYYTHEPPFQAQSILINLSLYVCF